MPVIRDRALDALVVVACLMLSAEHLGKSPVVVVAAALLLALRRHAPLAVAWLTAAATAVLAVSGAIPAGPDVLWWPPAAPFAAYALMAFTSVRGPAVVAAAVALVALPLASPAEAGVRTAMFTAGAVLLGLYVTARRQLIATLRERAERAERERHLLGEQARGEERVRLAAEIHDLVTHRVTLMVLQAGALNVSSADAATRESAESLRATGCQALDELRELVGVLRGGDPGDRPASRTNEAAPLPALDDVVAESASVGVAVELVESGERSPVSPAVGRTARRVVQEALTNVRKHAPGAAARVQVEYAGDAVRLSVRNTAPARAADPALVGSGPGTGLLGLRQRVALVNGTLRAGPDGEGGFEVEVTLPKEVPART
ncbi:two-component sensor histidine kinase [Spongiactinospora rosea]|uniref:histidine kinase n=1 Tax=Spongiactinospora rosea TaxID=2248750 RepID=A0A366M6S8_9ACTN|nr:two-component sensor histidine kinase [Spongiactinospora rosea]